MTLRPIGRTARIAASIAAATLGLVACAAPGDASSTSQSDVPTHPGFSPTGADTADSALEQLSEGELPSLDHDAAADASDQAGSLDDLPLTKETGEDLEEQLLALGLEIERLDAVWAGAALRSASTEPAMIDGAVREPGHGDSYGFTISGELDALSAEQVPDDLYTAVPYEGFDVRVMDGFALTNYVVLPDGGGRVVTVTITTDDRAGHNGAPQEARARVLQDLIPLLVAFA